MKIAYANVIEDVAGLPGVYNKVRDQHAACRAAGLPMAFHVFSYNGAPEVPEGMFFSVLKTRRNKASKLYFQAREIRETLKAYDVVILRSLAWTPAYAHVMRKRPFKLITEHHTRPLKELISGKRYLSWAAHAVSRRAAMAQSDGILCLTREICQDVAAGSRSPTMVAPNGVDVDSIRMTGSVPYTGGKLCLAFVASAKNPWHGLDRLLAGLEHSKGNESIWLHLMGDMGQTTPGVRNPRVKIICHGALDRPGMDTVLSGVHLGISSLGIFRNRMREACVLKTREYMARGLPFVYAYDDPDLDAGLVCVKKLPAREEPVDVFRLIEFAKEISEKTRGKRLASAMRQYAVDRMDWKPKMEAIIAFARNLGEGRLP